MTQQASPGVLPQSPNTFPTLAHSSPRHFSKWMVILIISSFLLVIISIVSIQLLSYQKVNKQQQFTSITPTPTLDPTANWKTYKSEKYAFEFQYPDHWKVDEDNKVPFVQLQQIKNGEIESIAGGITIIEKAKSNNYHSTYLKMYASSSKCPTVAGKINLFDTTNVYCMTGKELQINDGVWKGAVECSAASFYGLKEDPETCPHQFWIDTKNFFYIIHFNFFEPIKENSEQETFLDQILSTFKFL